MKRGVKALIGSLAYRTGLHRRLFAGRAMIVVFHRIDDALARRGDAVSCSLASFRAYCDFFARYFEVVPLSELLATVRRGEDVSRRVAITLDDGYADSFELAAPELRARQLPACFFLATDYVGSERQAPWDEERGVRSRWMTWDQVREIHGQGFELGAHTCNHLDLSDLPVELARREIAGSKERLEREIGGPIALFSYPFGGRDQISEENRALVREAGFDCCLAAYGGTLVGRCDPYHMQRIIVSQWYASPWHFGFEAMLQGPSGAHGI